MINWFAKLPGLKKKGGNKALLPYDLLQPFEDFLGVASPASHIIYWMCINYGKRRAFSLNHIFEQLGSMQMQIEHDELVEAFADLLSLGWVVQASEVEDEHYNIMFSHQFEVALRTGDKKLLHKKSRSGDLSDRMLLSIYGHAVLFKSNITNIDSWLDVSLGFISCSDHEIAKIIRGAKLNKQTQALVLFVYLMHAVEARPTEQRSLSLLFSVNPIEARRLLYEWNSPDWKPISKELLCIQELPLGPSLVFPTQRFLKRIYGLEDGNEGYGQLPSTLILLAANRIPEKQLFYNPPEAANIKLLQKMLKPTAFTKYNREARKIGDQTGITILLSGGPGAGKTLLSHQLARASGRDLLLFNVAEQRDKYYGESEKNIKQVFDCYNELAKSKRREPILLFNEADSVFQNRQSNNNSSTNSSENAIQTILLNELERFSGILICTTNRPDMFDFAFIRRFLMRITINPPCETVRFDILKHLFPDVPATFLQTLAGRYPFTAAELDNFRKLFYMQKIAEIQLPDKAAALEHFLVSLNKKARNPIGFRV